MFDTGGRAASAQAARRRLDQLTLSLAGELADQDTPRDLDEGQPDAAPATAEPHAVGDGPRPHGRGRHAARSLPRSARAVAGAGDRLPVPVRAWATRLSGQHLAVVAIVVAVGLCLAAWWGLASRPQAQAMPVLTPSQAVTPTADGAPTHQPTPTDPPVASPTTGPSSSGGSIDAGSQAEPGGVVVIDVAGKVRRPGIVTLPAGSRVADALDAAGGPRGDVDLTSLNLARVLIDGEQLLVGVEAATPPAGPPPGATTTPTAGPSAGGPVSLVNLNTASESELDTLPGIGPVTAQAILGWRTEHGGFTSVDELLEVTGIGEVTLEELRPLVTV